MGRQMKKAVKALRGSLGPVVRGSSRRSFASSAVGGSSFHYTDSGVRRCRRHPKLRWLPQGSFLFPLLEIRTSAAAAVGGIMSLTSQLIAAIAAGGKVMGTAKGDHRDSRSVGGTGWRSRVLQFADIGAWEWGHGAAGVAPSTPPPAFFKSGGAIKRNWLGSLTAP